MAHPSIGRPHTTAELAAVIRQTVTPLVWSHGGTLDVVDDHTLRVIATSTTQVAVPDAVKM